MEKKPQPSKVLQPYLYEQNQGREGGRWLQQRVWEGVESEGERIGMVTWNVWFDRKGFLERCHAQVRVFAEELPVVIALQEVTPRYVEEVMHEPFIQAHYALSHMPKQISGYGNILLIARSVHWLSIEEVPIPSYMGRKLLLLHFERKKEKFCIGTVHLESLNSNRLRAEQLKFAAPYFKPHENCVLMGDFNFDAELNWYQHLRLSREFRDREIPIRRKEFHQINLAGKGEEKFENENIAEFFPDFIDVWPYLHPLVPGYTYDDQKNSVIKLMEQMRYDRVLFKSGTWKVENIKLIGTEAIAEDLYPSDHFGLCFTLSLK